MKLNSLLFFCLLITLNSCNGQNNSGVANKEQTTIGDTVTALDKTTFIIFQAKDSSYWFGSNDKGVYHYKGKTLIHFDTRDGLSNDTIREIQEDGSGNIYFTTHNGINRFDGEKFITLLVDKTEAAPWRSGPNDLWFKGEPGKNGPYRFDGKKLYHLEFPKHYMEDEVTKNIPNQQYSPYEIYYIYKDRQGNIWFGTGTLGICRYDVQANTLSWLYEDHLQFVPAGGSFGIRSIMEDRNGKFWFCNTRYRYTIFPEDSIGNIDHFIKYKKEKGIELKAPDGNDHVYFMSIVEDEKGGLWMATYGTGVWHYDGSKVTHYVVKDGAKEITLFSIYKDLQGDLWLGTHEAGAYKFNGKTFEKFKP